jgi:hypothetical protein
MWLFHEEKKLKARVRLTSHNILEIANPSRIHSHSRKEAAKGQRLLARISLMSSGAFLPRESLA